MKRRIWLPILVLLVALLISIAVHVEKRAELEQWLSTAAQVETVDVSKRKKAGKSSHTISYVYEVEGVLYHGANTYSGRNSEFSAGDVTEIWYDPAAPQNSSFHKPDPLLHSLVPISLGAVVAVVLYRKQEH